MSKGLQENSLSGSSLHRPDIGGNSDCLECVSKAEGDLLSLQIDANEGSGLTFPSYLSSKEQQPEVA